MFSNKKETVTSSAPEVRRPRPAAASAGALNVIGAHTTIEGSINCDGDMRIDGKITGTVTCNGKLVVTDSGTIEGDINCKDTELGGQISSNIRAKGKVTIRPSAFVKGDVRYTEIEIEPGAHIACTISRISDKAEKVVHPSAAKKVDVPTKENAKSEAN